MSMETMEWLNTNVLVGFTDKRGFAWHYDATRQGTEDNHYAGPVPVEDVARRLFNWVPVKTPALYEFDGQIRQADREVLILRSDTGKVLGQFKDGYEPHEYNLWLVKNVESILDDKLNIGSAGLLKGGAVAWVSVEVPENLETPEGVVFRPNLLATTSFDGSLATTYKRCVTNVVCDNTMAAGLAEKGETFRVKHTKYSAVKLGDARQALGIVYGIAEDFEAEVKALCETTVSDAQWDAFLAELAPIPEDASKRSVGMATKKQDELRAMYLHDNRVAPWKGTAWGVMQAVNTYTTHKQIVRGTNRSERNMLRAVTGAVDETDQTTAEILGRVLQAA